MYLPGSIKIHPRGDNFVYRFVGKPLWLYSLRLTLFVYTRTQRLICIDRPYTMLIKVTIVLRDTIGVKLTWRIHLLINPKYMSGQISETCRCPASSLYNPTLVWQLCYYYNVITVYNRSVSNFNFLFIPNNNYIPPRFSITEKQR